MEKAELRRSLLKARQAMHPDVWREKSERLCCHLEASEIFRRSQTILAYFSFRQEPDLTPLFTTSQQWGFPRCSDRNLSWHYWSPHHRLPPPQPGAYGILEPHPSTPLLQPEQVDLILVPAVACDVRGYRLGYGGGFYDRMLSQPGWLHKPTIGIVFEFARLPKLPVDPWDRPLRGICTEAGLFL
ncbi:5-formyltetrahydrofolate cyclo-ligase [Leptolyngbya sp. FACHB-541]|uniref:5-formyltetrahydrofolate cyclo-ligase n=1 Tax=Leptolyngbya sp. FACHB-541 TaxID=2692810 RepID=UPI001686DAB3|nr:5-formyltetrahydrofolate cyclo-ligase [Leptolyngbya sp. FACHB-541]MBD1999435.1 5-formyltetrahydrofolate cyclo-ligase [Leptolyngbya sp. FACHB-541]